MFIHSNQPDSSRKNKSAAAGAGMADFFNFDIAAYERTVRLASAGRSLAEEGARRALALFHAAAARVPAYRDFLKRERISPDRIKTIADFAGVPETDKKNYITRYPIEKRCWDGDLTNSSILAVSSGTSGQPTFWPRPAPADIEAAFFHEFIYRYLLGIDKKKSTLLVIGFPMGVYVSGVATALPSWLMAAKGYRMTVATVGNNKEQVLKVIGNGAGMYDQIVLMSHPFFAKDVIETGAHEGIAWKKVNLKLMFCSEGFTEGWRRYLGDLTGTRDPDSSIINTYGASELLLIGYETPATIRLRQHAEKNKDFSKQLFGLSTPPHLFQYDPVRRYVESNAAGELIFTCDAGTPLVRFNLHDAGYSIPFSQMRERAGKDHGPSTSAIFKNAWQLPFLAMNGRSDYTIIFYAANIYPDNIRVAIQDQQFFAKLTGKFVMRKDYLKNMDEFLEINVELREGQKGSAALQKAITSHIVATLRSINMEYAFLCRHLEKDLTPRVVLCPYADPTHFKPGLKPKYIEK